MIVELTASEQQTYIPSDDTTRVVANLPALRQDGKARSRRIWIVEGGHCSDTRYEDNLKEKVGQHLMLQTALEDHGTRSLRVTFPHHNTSLQTATSRARTGRCQKTTAQTT